MSYHSTITDPGTIIRLIENDLLHAKLCHGLSAISLNPSGYLLTLNEIILEALDYERAKNPNEIREWYKKQKEIFSQTHMGKSAGGRKIIAIDIYRQLCDKLKPAKSQDYSLNLENSN